MDNTPFSKRVQIMGDFYADVCEDVEIMDTAFMLQYRDTLWICLAASVGYVTINDSFSWGVDDAWSSFCNFLSIDKYGDYDNYQELLAIANV